MLIFPTPCPIPIPFPTLIRQGIADIRTHERVLYMNSTYTFYSSLQPSTTELVFVNLLRSPGIDSQHGGPVLQPYLTYWPARLHRLVESIP
jgi:hypothetical protein